MLFDSKATHTKNNIDVNYFITMEVVPLQPIKMSFSLQSYQYQQKNWQDLLVSEGNMSYQFNNRHQLLFSGKYFDFVNNRDQNRFSLSAEYIIPFNMPVYPRKRLSDLIVEVRDPYQNKPVKNLLIQSNQLYALTNDSGRAEFLNIPHGEYLISAVNAGNEYLINPQMPDKLNVKKKEKLEKEYQLIKPARLTVKIIEKQNLPLKFNGFSGQNDLRFVNSEVLNQQTSKNSNISRGILFVLENDQTKIVKEADLNGQIQFDNILEGSWKLYPVKQSIPDHYEFNRDIMELEIHSARDYNAEFELVPISIPFESFSNGGEVKISD